MNPLRVIQPHKLAGSPGLAVMPGISEGSCRLAFVEEPRPDEIQPFAQTFWAQCQAIYNACVLSNTVFILQLQSGGDACPHRRQFCSQEMNRAVYDWCHWKINHGGKLADSQTILLSNQFLQSRRCRCDTGRQHFSLLSSDCKLNGKQKFRMQCEFGVRMLVDISHQLSVSPTSPIDVSLRPSPDGPNDMSSGVGPLNIPDSQERLEPREPLEPPRESVKTHLQISQEHPVATAPESSLSVPLPESPEHVYPTDSKERERIRRNELKAQGVDTKALVKKKIKYVEPHFDDCGDDISSISSPEDCPALIVDSESDDEFRRCFTSDESETSEEEDLGDGFSLFSCWGSPPGEPLPSTVVQADSLEHAISLLASAGKGLLDICEICGGEARTTQLGIRRRLATGRNFDLVCGVDLNSPTQQKKVLHYIREHQVMVVIMSPTCGPFGALSHLVKAAQPSGWAASYAKAAPHGRFCGVVALLQLREGRHFVNEQPDPSNLYDEEPWPQVLAHPSVVSLRRHRCQESIPLGCFAPTADPRF